MPYRFLKVLGSFWLRLPFVEEGAVANRKANCLFNLFPRLLTHLVQCNIVMPLSKCLSAYSAKIATKSPST
jgi:hypothetical protein